MAYYYEELRHHMGHRHRSLLLPGSVVIILNDKNEILSRWFNRHRGKPRNGLEIMSCFFLDQTFIKHV